MSKQQQSRQPSVNQYSSIIFQVGESAEQLSYLVSWLHKTQVNSGEFAFYTNQTVLTAPNITFVRETEEEKQSSITIDTVRNFIQQLAYSNYQGQKQYYVFLDADRLTIPAQNALLKSVEEPPENTQIIFITAYVEKLLETIRSRCTLVTFPTDTITKSHDESRDMYLSLLQQNYGQKIATAATYKERAEAQLLCKSLILFFHNELQKKDSQFTRKALIAHSQKALQSNQLLEQNVNISLVLEDLFFSIREENT